MTTEEIEDVVRALIAAVENLESGAAKQSMQEAFMHVRAYALNAQSPLSSKRNVAAKRSLICPVHPSSKQLEQNNLSTRR
jgi:hypothetical protein